jgi:hypothetical protein
MTQTVNPRMTPEVEASFVQHQVDEFNRLHPPGSTVWWWCTSPHGPVYQTEVESAAYIVPPGQSNQGMPVVHLVNVTGYVSMHRVHAVQEDRRNATNPIALDYKPPVMVAQAQTLGRRGFDSITRWQNFALPGYGERDHLARAAEFFRQAAESLEQAHRELGEGC